MHMFSCLRTGLKRIFPSALFLCLLIPTLSFGQQKSITGVVKDDAGELLSNISVVVKKTSKGTSTDAKGSFKINAAIGDEILFTATGREEYTLKVDAKNEYVILLKSKTSELNEVVVVGFGRQRKVNLVGAVSQINVDERLSFKIRPTVMNSGAMYGYNSFTPALKLTLKL